MRQLQLFSVFSSLNEQLEEKEPGNQVFFNTIKESGETLKKSKEDANKQEQRIMELMTEPCTPFEVHEKYCSKHPEVPITSIRRAMSNLTDKGDLIKTDEKKKEKYGKANYIWKRAPKNI